MTDLSNTRIGDLMKGKKALIVGVANEHSIAYGIARSLSQAGAELAVTYQTDKGKAFVEPSLAGLNVPIFAKCDVTQPGDLEAVFESIEKKWGQLDVLVHAIAFAPRDDLHGRGVDCSLPGFLNAMDVSCHSFIRMAKLAEPLMKNGGAMFTLTYYGSEKAVPNYNMMGPVKAALESTVRYLALELGEGRIRVNAISPGPMQTRAASGLKKFEHLLSVAAERAPTHQLVTLDEVGRTTTFLASDLAPSITGEIIYIDGGYHIVG